MFNLVPIFMEELGKIIFPEQYVPVGKEFVIDNSAAALAFFEKYYEKGGVVFFGALRLFSLTTPILQIWMYFDLDEKDPRLVSVIPAYKVENADAVLRAQIIQTLIHEHEIFFIVEDTLYSSLFTSKGETVLMRVRSLLNAKDATEAISLIHGGKVTDVYPVELYSHSAHKFIGVCWAVTVEDEEDKVFWYPMCIDETEIISSYSIEDVSDHPINVGETAVIGGDTYICHYAEDTGIYFSKVKQLSLKCISRIQKTFKQSKKAKRN